LIFSNHKPESAHANLYNAFATEDYKIEKAVIKSEFSIQNVGRLDIYIELTITIAEQPYDIKLIVENKVESKENNDQTHRYFKHFLTEAECSCKEFIQINYQSIVDYLIEPALKLNISEWTKNILTEYLNSLSQPAINNETDTHKQELIMALGNEERKLLASFWNKNQKLILASLYAISSDPEQEKDTRDSIRTALDNLSPDKDRSTFELKYKGKTICPDFKKSDIGLRTIRLLNDENLIDDKIIEYLKEDKSCSFFLLKKKEDFTETEIKYRKYRINDVPELIYKENEFYVARNWGIGNIDKFIAKFTGKFPGLEYKKNEKIEH